MTEVGKKVANPGADAPPASQPETPAEATAPVAHGRVVIIPTRAYWIVLALSLLFLGLTLGFYEDYFHWSSLPFYYANIVLGCVLILWCLVGLGRRYRVVHNTIAGTRNAGRAVSDGLRNTSEAHEGAVGRFVAKWANRLRRVYLFFHRLVVGTYRLVVRILYLPYVIVVWAYYTAEKILLRSVIILYDIVYYPLYAAWRLAWWAIRTSIRIAWWALAVVWKILRIPTKFPGLKWVWTQKLRPPILAWWQKRVDAFEAWKARRIAKGRHHAELFGNDPDAWEADLRRRRAFPLPHPEAGRAAIRKRIQHVKAVQRARKEGQPVPKWESPRAALREKRRQARRKEKEEQLEEKRRRLEEKKRAKEEKKAAKKKEKDNGGAQDGEADADEEGKRLAVFGKGKKAKPAADA